MRSSPYIGLFGDRVKLWEKKLTTIQEVLDEWLKMRAGGSAWSPSSGAARHHAADARRRGGSSKTVDTTWRTSDD